MTRGAFRLTYLSLVGPIRRGCSEPVYREVPSGDKSQDSSRATEGEEFHKPTARACIWPCSPATLPMARWISFERLAHAHRIIVEDIGNPHTPEPVARCIGSAQGRVREITGRAFLFTLFTFSRRKGCRHPRRESAESLRKTVKAMRLLVRDFPLTYHRERKADNPRGPGFSGLRFLECCPQGPSSGWLALHQHAGKPR